MTPYIDDPDFTLHVGDALEVLQHMPAESVHCVVTSPPYWGLRDYGTEGQLGLEPTPDQYVTNMVNVFREVRRVLRTDGTLWLNIGDSYASDAAKGGSGTPNGRNNRGESYARPGLGGLKQKDLVGIPSALAFALRAGFSTCSICERELRTDLWPIWNGHRVCVDCLLATRHSSKIVQSEPGWYLRSDIIWAKPNPMPESVTDRPTKAHEYLFLLTKSPRYFYDADAIREPYMPSSLSRGYGYMLGKHGRRLDKKGTAEEVGAFLKEGGLGQSKQGQKLDPNLAGRNRRSVWEIATEPYPDAHFATFPQALVEPCIKAGTSEHGCCPECGAPWVREVERSQFAQSSITTKRQEPGALRHDGDRNLGGQQFNKFKRENPDRLIGWRPTCDRHAKVNTNYPVPCTVLDPFLGSGTTAQVARRLGRKSIGIELNPEYAQLAARRLQQQTLFACTIDESAGLAETTGSQTREDGVPST